MQFRVSRVKNEILLRIDLSILSHRRCRLAAGWLDWQFIAICDPLVHFHRGFDLVSLAHASEYGFTNSSFDGENCDSSAVQRMDNRMERTLRSARNERLLGRTYFSPS